MKSKSKKQKIGKYCWVAPSSQAPYNWRAYYWQGPKGDRKRVQKSFKVKTEAIEWAQGKDKELVENGDTSDISKDDRFAVNRFRELIANLPEGAEKPSLLSVVEDWAKQNQIRKKSTSVALLVDQYIDSLIESDRSRSHIYSTKLRLEKFRKKYGDWIACDITPNVIKDFLLDLKLGDLTTNHHRQSINQMFNFGMIEQVVNSNPTKIIKPKKIRKKEIEFLTVSEAEGLLRGADEELIPSIAIGLFAGLRRAEIGRLDWEDILWEQWYVRVRAEIAKGAARRLIPMGEALGEWLAPYRGSEGKIMPSEMRYRSMLNKAKAKAGIDEWPHNALRDSFCTYHYSFFENAEKLAKLMGHKTTDVLFDHYAGLATKEDGKRFWEIKPL